MKKTLFQMKLLLNRRKSDNLPIHLLGMDLGTQFVGLSICILPERPKLLGSYKATINVIEDPHFGKEIRKIIKKNKINAIIVGEACTESMKEKFVLMMDKIAAETTTPFLFFDETCTSVAAQEILQTLNLPRSKQLTDSISSLLIIQNFLSYYEKK